MVRGLTFVAAAAGATSWSAIVLAVLGSSAVGAIAGGYLTTRLRGTIERDEAWRTRLIDCADTFLSQLGRTVTAIPHSWLAAVQEGKDSIRIDDRLTATASRAIADFDKHHSELLPLKLRVELLFGPNAREAAREAFRIVENAGEVFKGATWGPDTIAQDGLEGLGINVPVPNLAT
jgi:hypothetical protein